jgi:sugar lactone lactonase YvrE
MSKRLELFLLCVWLSFPGIAHAVAVRSWSASTEQELGRGTLDGTAIDAEGRVRLAPEIESLWGPGEGVVWDVIPAGERAAFVALSGPGRVLRLAAGKEPELWYTAPDENLVTAIAADDAGGVVFGVSPEGAVYRARSRKGEIQVEKLADTGAQFVWGLAREAGGKLWIATGAPGRLLRLERDGEATRVFDAGDDPVRSLSIQPGGGVVLGTGGRGRILRVDREGRAFVVLDAEETEIVSVAVRADGTIYAAAAKSGKQPRSSSRSASSGVEAQEGVRVVVGAPEEEPGEEGGDDLPPPPPSASSAPPQSFKTQPGGAIYRIDPDGTTRRIWATGAEMPFAVALGRENLVYVGTGDSGRVFALDEEGRSSSLLRVPSEQVSAMHAEPSGRVLVGATSDARVAWIRAEPRRKGSWASPAVDAGNVADWGRLRWDSDLPSGTSITVQARSGNTAEPDDTWSPWIDLAAAEDRASAETRVPPARWFQARFSLATTDGGSPELRRVEIAYRSRNRPPEVESVQVDPPGVVWVRGPAQSSFPVGPTVADDPVARDVAASLTRGGRMRGGGAIRRTYEAGARTFSWAAIDPDGDRLRYSLALRRDGSEEWFPLAADIDEDFLSSDARAWPDGIYRVRLSADDAADNPNGTHLHIERISDAFRVDNTRPSVGEHELARSGRMREVRFVARDPGGSVAAVEVALDGGPWMPLSPQDGVADSELESYRLELEPVDAQARSIIVRVTDSSGNLGGAMWSID